MAIRKISGSVTVARQKLTAIASFLRKIAHYAPGMEIQPNIAPHL
jgi:hypothetical protein